MTRSIVVPALLGIMLAAPLAGCGGTANRGLETVHQPVVSRADYAIDLNAPAGSLAAGEAQRLDGWLTAMRLGYGDRIAIDAGDDGVVADDTVAAVAGVVARFGMLLGGRAPAGAAPLAAGTIRIVVSRMRAHVPGCPDWSRHMENEFDGNAHSNHGCATNVNLAAMIANPADLVRGQSDAGPIDPTPAAKAIDAYRTAPTTGAAGLPGGVSSVSVVKGK